MKSRVAWMLAVTDVVFNIGFWGCVAWVPTHLVTARRFSLVAHSLPSTVRACGGS